MELTVINRRWWLLLVTMLSLFGLGLTLYAWLIADLPSPGELSTHVVAPSTKIYDRKGRLLFEAIAPYGGKHTPLPLDQIPLYLRQATVATEDAAFYTNPGVDFRAILRAIIINLRGGEAISGGSTITQQLARNLILSPEERIQRTLRRKLREAILAWRLARIYFKDEILALYLNETYYGNFAYGVEAAAQAYFGKSVGDMDLAECALLAGLPQSPAAYNPSINPEAAKERQGVVLDLMVKAGYIIEEQAKLAKEEQLHFAASPFPIEAPHFVMYVRGLLEREFGLETLRRKGLNVYTTLDLDLQERARSIVNHRLAALAEKRPCSNITNAALVALDPRTGEILAMLGSPDYFDREISGAVNACLALRQPGSSIKPITYAAALSLDYTPATMVNDVRTTFVTKEGEPYTPLNYDLTFHGPVLLREALASSYNIPAVKVLDHVGLDNVLALARRLGITTFDESERYGLSLTLGGGEVRLLELTATYGAFANGGFKVEPVAILRVEDDQGDVLREWHPHQDEQVLDERVAHFITDILSDDTARIPAFGEGSVLELTRPAAVKTGTTSDWRDNWTIGYTPDLVCGVWVGNAMGAPMQGVSGITGAAPIWHDFVEEALKGKPVREFVEPEGIVHVEVCALSGKLPSRYCPYRREEIFIAGTKPQEVCTLHRPVAIDAATGEPATPNTPPERVVERVFTFLPAEARQWGRKRGIPDPPIASRISPLVLRPSPLVMTSPPQSAIYRLSRDLPRHDQRIEVSARPGEGMSIVSLTLYVDDEPLACLEAPPYRVTWPLEPGKHVFRAIGCDSEGNRLESETVCITVE